MITMLPNGERVASAIFGPDSCADALAEDALFIDMSTILPAFTDREHDRNRLSGSDAMCAIPGARAIYK